MALHRETHCRSVAADGTVIDSERFGQLSMPSAQGQQEQRLAPNRPPQDVNELALQKGMPVNLEAEKFVLGTVLLNSDKFEQVAGALAVDDFSTEKHRRIFRCMNMLHERGERIEYLTVGDELKKFKWLENVGGLAYVATLTDGMPRLDSIDSYTRIVKSKSTLRKLIDAANGIVADCLQEGREVEDILADSESAVMQVGSRLIKSGLQTPRETIEAFEGGLSGFLSPSKRNQGLETPFYDFNEMTNGLRSGQLIVLAARPSMGKTAMALNIAAHLAMGRDNSGGRTVAIFSLEMSREALLTRVLCAEARVDQTHFRRDMVPREDRSKLVKCLNSIVQSKLFIDDTASISVMEIAAKCRRLQSEHGLDLVIVDYLQLLGSKGTVESRVQEVSTFSRGLKLLARDLEIPVIALSQLSRGPESQGRRDARPKLSDLRDSGSIEQDADVVAFIFREEVYKPKDARLSGLAELIVGKQRNGPIGIVKLVFLKQYARFDNRADDDDENGAPKESTYEPPPTDPTDETAPF